jgi:hypothetical protein
MGDDDFKPAFDSSSTISATDSGSSSITWIFLGAPVIPICCKE